MSEENKDVMEIKLSAPVKVPEIEKEETVSPEKADLKLKSPGETPAVSPSVSANAPSFVPPPSPVNIPAKKQERRPNRRRGCLGFVLMLLIILGGGGYSVYRYRVALWPYWDRMVRFMSFHWVNQGELSTTDLEKLNAQDAMGRSEFHFAAKYGDVLLLEKLFEAKADPMLVDKDKNNLLHYAAESGSAEALELLLKKRLFKVNSANTDGNTPLHIAAKYNRLDAVRILLKYGAGRGIANKDGKIPMELTDDGNVGNWLIPTSREAEILTAPGKGK